MSRSTSATGLSAAMLSPSTDRAPATHGRDFRYQPDRLAVLGLDGDLRLVPEGWRLSPDARYALRPGERVVPPLYLDNYYDNDTYLWKNFEVLDAESGDVLWTVEAGGESGFTPYDRRIWGRSGLLGMV